MPRAVLFDLYNTLVSSGPDSDRHAVAQSMGADLGVDPSTYADLYHQVYPQRFVGALGDLEATVRAVARMAGGEPTDAAVRLAAARRMTLFRRLLWPSGPTLAALDSLRAGGWRVGLVSNCSAETPELWKRTPFATRFDAVGFSCELGVVKPDPAIFLAVCSFLGVAPGECLYVGDGADNELSGAANLGMAVVRTEEYVPADSAWPRDRIATLAELGPFIDPRARSPRSAPAG